MEEDKYATRDEESSVYPWLKHDTPSRNNPEEANESTKWRTPAASTNVRNSIDQDSILQYAPVSLEKMSNAARKRFTQRNSKEKQAVH